MENSTHSTIQDDTFENIRNLILCEDIIKKLRPAIVQYAVEVRHFIHTSMVRGFERNMIRHSIAVFLVEIMSLVTMAEELLASSNSPKAKILESELEALKSSIKVFVQTSEKMILEKPETDNQMFLGNNGRIG